MHSTVPLQKRIKAMMWLVVSSAVISVMLASLWFFEALETERHQARVDAVELLRLEESLTQARSALNEQVREWKDSLLRAHEPTLFAKHQAAYHARTADVQRALTVAQAQLETLKIGSTAIVTLKQQYQLLLAQYAKALTLLDLKNPLSYQAVDRAVLGADRQLFADLSTQYEIFDNQMEHWVNSVGQAQGIDQWAKGVGGLGMLAVLLPLISMLAFLTVYKSLTQLSRQDQRTSTIFEAIGDAVVVVNAHGRVESLNSAAQKLMGWSDDEAKGKPLGDVFSLTDMQTNEPQVSPVDLVLSQRKAVAMSNGLMLHRPDGSRIAIEDSAAPVFDQKGELFGVVMVFHDVSSRYAVLNELAHERTLYAQTFNQASVGMAQVSPKGQWLKVNQKLCSFTGYSEAEILSQSFRGITHPDDVARDEQAIRDVVSGKIDSYEVEKRYIHKDGSLIWGALSVSLVRDTNGQLEFAITIIQDITARKMAEQAAAHSQLQFSNLFEQMPEGVLLVNDRMEVIDANKEAKRQLGYDADEFRQLRVWDFETTVDSAILEQRNLRLSQVDRDDFESIYKTRDGAFFDVDVSMQRVRLDDDRTMFQVLFRDITSEKQAAAQIEHMAYHDQLTGLANRRLLADRMAQAVHSAIRHDTQFAVLYIDLDHFKLINDSLGHSVGDKLLREVAKRLTSLVRADDTVARMGGDEFVVMLSGLQDSADAASMAQRIVAELSTAFLIDQEELVATPSIGISLCPQDGRDADELLKHADAALYQAKQSGRCTHRFYTHALQEDAQERLKIERLLYKAIERQEFELYYQPQVALDEHRIVGCEALIRWNQPTMGLVSPGRFIPIAEHSNLINQIGNWVMRQACFQARQWEDQGYKLKVSFNVSARQFMHPDELLTELRGAILESGVTPGLIGIEITESLLLDDQLIGKVLHDIHEMGVRLSLDDFGTGYSSLSYLRRFPIHVLKIDQSFVSQCDQVEDVAVMVKTIIGMAHNLRMELVAEGVETVEQMQLLQGFGCEVAQGYYFGRPAPAAQFEAFLASV